MSKKHKNTSTIPPLGSPPIKTSKSTSKSASGSHTQSSSMPKSSSITHTSTSTPPARLVKQTSHGKVPLLAFGQSEGQSTPTKGMVILRKSQTSKWSAGYKSRKSDLEFWYQFSIGEDQFSQQRNLRVPFWFLTKEAESPPTSTPQQVRLFLSFSSIAKQLKKKKKTNKQTKASVEDDGTKKPQGEAPKDAPEEGAPKDELKPKVEVRLKPISKAGSKGNVFESPLLDFTPKKLSLKSYQEWEDKMHAEVEERIRKSRSPDEDQSLPPTFSRSPRRKVEDVVLNLTPEMRAKLKSYDIDSLKKLGINVSDLEHSHMNGNDVDSTHCNIDLPSSDSPFSVSLPSLHLGESHASVHNSTSSSSSSSSSSNTQHGILDRSSPENSSSDPSATSLSGSHEHSDPRSPLSPKNESGTLVSLTASDGQYESDAEHVSFPPSSPHNHNHDSFDDPNDLSYLSSPRQTEPSSPQRSVSPRRRKKDKEREREKEKEREKERALLFSPRDKDKDREKKDSKKGKKKLNIGSSAMKFMRTPRGNVGPTPRKNKKGGDDLSNTVEARIQQELLTMELLSSCVDEQSLRAVITQGAVEKLITETYHPAKKKGIMIELLDDEEGRRESIAAVREYQKEKHEREKREKEKPSDPADLLNSSSSSSSSPSLSVLDTLSPSSPNYILPLSPKPSSSPSLTASSPPRDPSPSSESPISRDADQKDG